MKRRRNPVGKTVARPSNGRGKRFDVRIPGVNISISLQPTRKGITIVKPRVSRVTISRNPRKRNPLIRPLTSPGHPALIPISIAAPGGGGRGMSGLPSKAFR